MSIYPIKVQPISMSDECQFYVKNNQGNNVCFVKQAVPLKNALSQMERESSSFDPLTWKQDCKGVVQNCTFIPFFYEPDSDAGASSSDSTIAITDADVERYITSENKNPNIELMDYVELQEFSGNLSSARTAVADFDPFDSKGDDETEVLPLSENVSPSVVSAVASAVLPTVESTANNDTASSNVTKPLNTLPLSTAANSIIKFKIKKVNKPWEIYQANPDILVMPANTLLSLPDKFLNQMSKGSIQRDLDAILKKQKVRIGQMYLTNNGDAIPNPIQAKKILHAVVAAETWVSNVNTITQLTPKVLHAVDALKAETVAIVPFDCGTVDIEACARAQLIAIRKFLYSNKIDCVKRLFILMSDEMSYKVYTDAAREIFYELIPIEQIIN